MIEFHILQAGLEFFMACALATIAILLTGGAR
jgi:hypothetical protein